MTTEKNSVLKQKTIEDFGEQWTMFVENDGHYASQTLFQDILGPLINISEIKGKKALDIGSGTGRIVNMLLDAGAAHVTAIEPSKAYEVLLKNTVQRSQQVTALNVPGDEIPAGNFEIAVSLGVIHHIPNPEPVMKSIYQALARDGKVFVWLYGKEGNTLYLFIYNSLKAISNIMPNVLLKYFCTLLSVPLCFYVQICRVLKFLPMASYMVEHLGKLSYKNIILTIFDQLNPAYAKYYTRDEAIALLMSAGFKNVEVYHRHGYSWTVTGQK